SVQRYVIFRTKADGWAALYTLVDKILSNQSAHYNTSMTFRQLARRYATSPTWVKNVTHNLGTTPGTTIAEYFDLPPVLVVRTNLHTKPECQNQLVMRCVAPKAKSQEK